MKFDSVAPAAGKSGKLDIVSSTNADYYKKNPMTKDAIHPMSLKATIPALGVSKEVEFKVEMQPFIREPSAFPKDIYYVVGTPKKTVSLTYPRHTG